MLLHQPIAWLGRGSQNLIFRCNLGQLLLQALIVGVEVVRSLFEITELLLQIADMPFLALTESPLAENGVY
jgi:hypothetical protein